MIVNQSLYFNNNKKKLHNKDTFVRNKAILFCFNGTGSPNSKTADSELWARQFKYDGAIPRYFCTDKINCTRLTIILFRSLNALQAN